MSTKRKKIKIEPAAQRLTLTRAQCEAMARAYNCGQANSFDTEDEGHRDGVNQVSNLFGCSYEVADLTVSWYGV